MPMFRMQALRALCAGALLIAATPKLQAQQIPAESASMLASVREHVALLAEGALRFDPRPLRPGFNPARHNGSPDLLDSARVVQIREVLAREIGLATADLVADRRCTFLVGHAPMPGRVLPPETQLLHDECNRRGEFTTFAMTVPVLRHTDASLCAAVHIRVAIYTGSGYSVWDLSLRVEDGRMWRVDKAERVFGIMS